MNKLRSSIEALKILRAELQNNVEKSVIEQLDEIIKNLETIQRKDQKIKARKLLEIFGKSLKILPTIAKIILNLTSK